MQQDQIRHIVEKRMKRDGMVQTALPGIQLFRATHSMPCAPAVYEPCVIAIVSGAKEAVLDGRRYVYDNRQYLCCPMSMPVQAGTPAASPANPLHGVYIALNPHLMAEIALAMESATGSTDMPKGGLNDQGITLARWGRDFAGALLRLLALDNDQTDAAVLGDGRLRELYYAILKGEAGVTARRAFGVGNAIARCIAHISANLGEPLSIEDLADRAGMSRAVFHRKFKQATAMSPIQFVKSMRLNNAAQNIAAGMTVSEAAMDVGYVSTSQFSRDFKRMNGQSPRRWNEARQGSMTST